MKRIPQLDGLRGIAVLMVFAYHMLRVPLTWAGVDLFFVLSGFLITGILLRLKGHRTMARYWSAFYFRRLLRIAPPYLGFIVILTLAFPIPWHSIWYWYAFSGANIASALRKDTVASLTPLWSLAVEEQFYFIWPWVVLLCGRNTLKRVALGIMIAAPILRGVFTPLFASRGVIYYLTPFRADSLACGALIAICAAGNPDWVERWRGRSIIAMLGSGALLAGLSVFPAFRLNSNSGAFNIFGFSLIVTLFGAALVWMLGMQDGFWKSLFASPPLRYMGRISYTFYLYQVLFRDKLAQHIGSHLKIVILTFVLTFLFSGLSWQFFESQILKIRLTSPVDLKT
jgi:peptidoglycan/LPS O-acetylase OafA/YrhL